MAYFLGTHPTTGHSYDLDLNDADQSTDALIGGVKWDMSQTSVLAFSFITSSSEIGYGYGGATFHSEFTTAQKDAAYAAFAEFERVIGITFEEQGDDPGEDPADGILRFGNFTGLSTAFGYYPNSSESGGDMAYNASSYLTPDLGTYEFATFMHEIGHAMGLKHGHETDGPGAMLTAEDSMEYSVMTYRSFQGQDMETYPFYLNSSGHYAQSLMMHDIAALQRLYGADFTTDATATTYTFDATTGEMSINGVAQGTPAANVTFRTVWDGNGKDTYDLSNFGTDLALDLTPGAYSDFDVGGNDLRARLNFGYGWNGTDYYYEPANIVYASGHLYNALQFEGDTRSLIENATGGSGNDLLTGNAAGNALRGNDGNDTAFGGLGQDNLFGGAGADALFGGDGNDALQGDAGGDTLDGGDGLDTVRYHTSANGVSIDLTQDENGYQTASGGNAQGDVLRWIERVQGSQYGDTLIGGDDGNLLTGNGGDDTMMGGAGNDVLIGGLGGDRLDGGDDVDEVRYSDSTAGVAINLIEDINGFQSASGGNATGDVLSGFERVLGSNHADTLTGNDGHNALTGGRGDDTIYGGSGNDAIRGAEGADTLDGGAGNDLLRYHQSDAGVTVDLNTFGGVQSASGGYASGDVISGFERVLGSAHGDTITGDGYDNNIVGNGGDDLLSGGAGDDTLHGGEGADTMDGGDGQDWLRYHNSDSGVTVNLATDINGFQVATGGSATGDVISNFEKVLGSVHDDTLTGGTGNDVLTGNRGDDIVSGGLGRDILYGRDGSDTLTGGAGSDVFHFEQGEGDDTVIDFVQGEDTLRIRDVTGDFAGIGTTIDGADLILDFGDGLAILIGHAATTLTEDDFRFV